MNIGGFEPLTLSDYPGRIAAIVFTQGCNFRCPFCHNGSLLPVLPQTESPWDEQTVLAMLDRRRNKLGGVVISGGEPTIQPDLPAFISSVRNLGLDVKLDTNGSNPTMLQHLIETGLLDYIAMDIKAPWHLYDVLAGATVHAQRISRSINLIAQSGIRHEFRTTVVEPLLTSQDVATIEAMIPSGSPHKQQTFRPELAIDPTLRQSVLKQTALKQPTLRQEKELIA